MKLKNILAFGAAIIISAVSSPVVLADDSVSVENPCKMGCIPGTQEEIEAFFGEPTTYAETRAVLPSSVDLSKEPYFPPIGDQRYLGACSSFATTYYQFTYEVNKMNGVTSKDDIVIYSPKWTYNLANNSIDEGSEIIDNYKVLEDLGCLKNADFPYTGFPQDYTEIPENMRSEKLGALSTRIDDYDSYLIPNTANITSPNSQALYNIKTALNQGKVLTSETECYFNSKYENGNCIAYRCTDEAKGTHAVAIVGYDDNISCDVNGNGIIEECEKGALKVANSWGTSFNSHGIVSYENDENAGYFWVLYDALNLVSANKVNNWESSLSGIRYPAFSVSSNSSGSNMFYSINVAHKKVNVVGELDINTLDREGIRLQINRTSSNVTGWQSSNAKTIANFNQNYRYLNNDSNKELLNQNVPFSGVLLFDYSSYTEPMSQYISGYNWHVSIDNIQSDKTVASLRLADSKGRVITGYKHLMGNNNLQATYHNLSLQKGDLDYDGEVTLSDSSILMNYVSMYATLSDLQYILADYNNDGSVDVADVVAINAAIMSKATSASEIEEINKLNARAYSFMATYGVGGNLNEIK